MQSARPPAYPKPAHCARQEPFAGLAPRLGGWARRGPSRGPSPMPDLLHEITRAAQAYYAQTSDFPLTATDFFDWLDALPAARRADVLARSFTTSQAEPDFLRWCLELRGYSMRDYMAEQLSAEAYALWAAHGEFNGDLPAHAVRR